MREKCATADSPGDYRQKNVRFRSRGLVVLLGVLLVSFVFPGRGSLTSNTAVRDPKPIRLKSRVLRPEVGLEPAVVQAAEKAPEAESYVYVQTQGLPSAATRKELRAQGVRLFDYLPEDTFVAKVPNRFILRSHTQGIAHPRITFIGEIRPEDKMDRRVSRELYSDYAIDPEGRIILAVWFHDDVPYAAAADLAARYGAYVGGKTESMNMVMIGLSREMIHEFAKESIVLYVAQTSPPMTEVNDSNRGNVGADTTQAAPYNLDGSGVTVLVYDAGLMSPHPDHASRTTTIEGGSESFHATHVGGTVGGNGTLNPLYKGMAPAVSFLSAYYESCDPLCLYDNPQDIEANYGTALSMGADLNTNSIGSNINPNGYDCDMEGDYEMTAMLVDQIACGSLGAPVLTVWAAGNERTGMARCGQYGTIGIAATAKNNLVVGATNSNDDSVTSFTSFGPTDDGRLRPDISGPGCQSNDDGGVTSTTSTDSYTALCGTSMATPTTSGILALAIEQFRRSYPTDPDPLPSTWKAMVTHTADDIESAGPDYRTGYGRINAVSLIDKVVDGSFLEDSVGNGLVNTYQIMVSSTDPMRVSIAWCDPAASPLADPTLVNNLNLELESPSGSMFDPWVLNPSNPAAAATTGVDTLNNQEQVFVASPELGTWTIRVRGASVPSGPQDYALVYDGTIPVADVLDLAVVSMAIDYDPSTQPIDPGPGELGQAVDVMVIVENLGSVAVRSASLMVQASVQDGATKTSQRVVDDFAAIAGVQTLDPGERSTIRLSFAAGVLDRCGTHTLVGSHDGPALVGSGVPVGDEVSGNDSLSDIPDTDHSPSDSFSPDLLELDFARIGVVIQTESETIEDIATERVKIDVDFDGLGPGGDMHHVRATVDIADEFGRIQRLAVVSVERTGVRSDVMRDVTLRVRLDQIFPLLEEDVLYRVRVRLRDLGSREYCAVSTSSNTFVIQR